MDKSFEISQANRKAIAKRKANAQFKKIKRAMDEVKEIEAGLIKPKTLQQLLQEL
jgi:hypothetical protein